ncbi:MAG TPA: hypothetical protein VF550_16880 [Polyangia bacterium]
MPNEAERIVVNTGPLIALGRIEAFDLIGRLPLAFIIPKAVADEIATGVRAGLVAGAKLVPVSGTSHDTLGVRKVIADAHAASR